MAVRIPDEGLAAIDAAVERGDHPTRSAAILAALRASARRERERMIAEECRRAYTQHPEGQPPLGTAAIEQAIARDRARGGRDDL